MHSIDADSMCLLISADADLTRTVDADSEAKLADGALKDVDQRFEV